MDSDYEQSSFSFGEPAESPSILPDARHSSLVHRIEVVRPSTLVTSQ